jgi:sterol desaturase/sphingolipid hydroxylase (fatty acid hydroxylase superfamily)
MHLPRKRHVERSGIFFRLNGHHLLHHRYMGKNFNVVLPLADLSLRTLLLRSKIAFAQARGSSVPDVQPKGNDPFNLGGTGYSGAPLGGASGKAVELPA